MSTSNSKFPARNATHIVAGGQIPNHCGFTFIEVIISVAVIFIIISITFAGYARLNQRQTLISAGQTLKNILRDAQSRAYTGEMDCDVCDCGVGSSSTLTGWYADFANKEIRGNCGAGNDFSNKNFGLSNDISLSATYNGVPVTKILFRSSPLGVDTPVTICLSLNLLTDNYYKITVGPSGEISDSAGLINECPLK